MASLKMRSPEEEEEEFEIIFQHAAESPWEEAEAIEDVCVPNDGVSSRSFPKTIYTLGEDTESTNSMMSEGDDDSSLDSPMELLGDVEASLPGVEEVWTYIIETGQGEAKSKNREPSRNGCPRYCCFLFVLVLLAIGSFLCGFSLRTRTAGNGDARYDDTTADDNAPRKSNHTEVKDFVIEHGISSRNVFDDSASPHARAASWLANTDQANLAVPLYDDSETPSAIDYVARYVMTVLYFATNGENWFQQFSFLTKGDVCTRKGDMMDASGTTSVPYGVVCANDGTIWGLYLGMYCNLVVNETIRLQYS
jgi:hypothetical protein